MGPEVTAFEKEVAASLGVTHAIGVNSGTDALLIALRAAGVGEGDEVITSPFTFFATAEAISSLGAVPVFVDIAPATFNIDPALIETALTSRTRAIVPVHLFGLGADMDSILALARRHGLKVVEDTAQAFSGEYRGSKLGSLGDIGAYSFFPSKNLGCYGDGGLIATNDDATAETARMLRVHGARKKYYNEVIGYNSRLDSLQAAILRVKLPHIEAWSEGRRRVAAAYNDLLGDLPGLVLPREAPGCRHVYHQYTVRIPGGRRDEVRGLLEEAGIGTMVYYPVPVHKLPIYAKMSTSCPQAERASAEVLSLPIWPQMEEKDVDLVAKSLKSRSRF